MSRGRTLRPTTGVTIHRRPRTWPVLRWAAAAAGAGLVVVVAADGSVPWRLARIVVVTACVAAVVRWRSAAGAAALGVVVTAVGVGIAGPHLAKTGITALAVAGALAAAGGIALLLAALVDVLRPLRGWRRPVVGIVAAVPVLVLVFSGVVAVAATNVPRTALGDRTPQDLGLPFEDVRFRTSDGVELSGWFVRGRSEAAVVLLHGSGSTRSSTLEHAAVLSRLGYGVLLFDARGHGRSGGRAMDLGWRGDLDVGGAVSYLAGRHDVDADRIAAVGLSMGGEEALGAAANVHRIRAVVAEGATRRVAADTPWLSERYGVRGAVQEWIDRLTYGLADLLTSASPPATLRDAVREAAPRPVLLITAGDVEEERFAAAWIRGGAPASVSTWHVEGAGHTDALATRPAAWERRVGAFLARALA